VIYFVQPVDGGEIKIGTSARLSRRLVELCAEFGGELQVLAVADGGYDQESALHQRFSHLRVHGEWFEPGDDLLAFIVHDARPWDGVDEAKPDTRKLTAIHTDVLKMARAIVGIRGGSVTQLISETCRPEFIRIIQEMQKSGEFLPKPEE
jgi:hypothetical protein